MLWSRKAPFLSYRRCHHLNLRKFKLQLCRSRPRRISRKLQNSPVPTIFFGKPSITFGLTHVKHRRLFFFFFLSLTQVDDYQNTNVDGVYAVGDACDKKVGLIVMHVWRFIPMTPHAISHAAAESALPVKRKMTTCICRIMTSAGVYVYLVHSFMLTLRLEIHHMRFASWSLQLLPTNWLYIIHGRFWLTPTRSDRLVIYTRTILVDSNPF